MARQNERKMKLYMEAGLAVLLVLTIALASVSGRLSSQAHEKDKNKQEAAVQGEAEVYEKNKGNDQEKNEVKDQRENNAQNTAGNAEESQETIADGQYPIMGNSRVTVDEMVDYFQTAGKPYPKEALSKGGAESIEVFCRMYYDEAVAEGVRPEVAFVQTMKETGFLQYGGDASVEQFNFAGLGALDGNAQGQAASFSDVRTGIRAQIQHLKAYGSAENLKSACVDPRFKYVTRNSAKYVEWLGIKENPAGVGWASDKNYGYTIVDMVKVLTSK